MGELIHYDKQLLLLLNGSDSVFLDSVIMTLTTATTWIPLYAALLYVVWRANWADLRSSGVDNRRGLRQVLLILAAAGLCVLLAGTIDDEIVKPLVARWRPTHDPEIGALVDVVDGYRGGNYGFFSAHASNTFSLAVFFSLLMRWRPFTCAMVAWSLLNCYTRMYLGVHFPGDITVGLIWGGFVGWLVYRLYCRVTTPARYAPRLLAVPLWTLLALLVYALVRAAVLTADGDLASARSWSSSCI